MVELMVGTLDKKHKGKLMLYNEEILNSNPSRQFIISVLSNLNDMILLKTKVVPSTDEQCEFIHEFSKHINFWVHGVKYIKQLHNLPKTAGYDEAYNFSIQISREYLFSFLDKYFILDTILLL